MATSVEPTAGTPETPAKPAAEAPAAPAVEKKDEQSAAPPKSRFTQKLDALRKGEPAPAKPAAKASEPKAGEEPAAPAVEAKATEPVAEPKDKGTEKAAEDAEPENVPRFTFKAPGRQPTDPDVDIPVDMDAAKAAGLSEKEIQDRLNQLRKGYVRGREVEAREQRAQEMEAVARETLQRITTQPVDLLDVVPPKHFLAIARATLARLSDAEFLTLAQDVERFDKDPGERKLAEARALTEANKRREDQRTAQEQSAARSEYVNQVADTIADIIPEDMEDQKAADFYEFAAFKLQQWGAANPQARLDPRDVPALLDKMGVLGKFGLALPTKAPQTGSTAVTPRAEPVAPKTPPKPAPEAAKDLQERHERRKNAATTPAGAGAPAASSGPPKGQSFKDRLTWFRTHGK